MRILHVIQSMSMGGAERIVVALVRGAIRAGHEADVAASPGVLAGQLPRRILSLPLIERKPWRLLPAASALRRAIRASEPDVLHCHNPAMALVAGLATLRGRRPTGLVTVHGVPEQDYASAARLLRLAGLPVVACGPAVAEALAEHDVSVRETIVNGVSSAPEPAPRAALAAEWDLSSGRRLLVSVGRLVPQKNHALAISALSEIADAVLIVLGEGPLLDELQRQAEAVGVADRVVFAGVRDDARAILGAADAVVMPSRWEGHSLVALEALAAETPIVATAVRGLREFMVDGQNCLLTPPDDHVALAQAVRRVLDDAQLAHRLSERGLRSAGLYSESTMVEAYLRLYRSIAKQAPESRCCEPAPTKPVARHDRLSS